MTPETYSVNIINPSDLTIVVPTKNRPELLHKLLRYWDAERVLFRVLVLVSGKKNKYLGFNYLNLNIDYIDFDSEIAFNDKLAIGLDKISSKFIAICADDDLVTIEGLYSCANFLKSNPDYTVAQGYHGLFCEDDMGAAFHSIAYFTPSLDEIDPVQRISTLMRRYQPVVWAVWRADVLKSIVLNMKIYTNTLFTELMWSLTPAILGKVKRLPILYCLRRIDSLQMLGHPFFSIIESPEIFLKEYGDYRSRLIKTLSYNHVEINCNIKRIIDIVHLYLFLRNIDTDRLGYFLDCILAKNEASIFDHNIKIALQFPEPDCSDGEKKKIIFNNRQYRFFPAFLEPEPKEEIHLPAGFEDSLVRSIYSYFSG